MEDAPPTPSQLRVIDTLWRNRPPGHLLPLSTPRTFAEAKWLIDIMRGWYKTDD